VRVGLVVPGFSANAEDWCIPALRDYVETLARKDDVRVLALRYPPSAARYHAFGAAVTALGGRTARHWGSVNLYRRALVTIASEHGRARFDLLHAFWADESGLVAAFVGRALGIPTIVSLAGGELVAFPDIAYGGQLSLVQRIKIDLALRLASAITVGSAYERELALRVAPALRRRPVQLLPLGVNLERFSPPYVEHQSLSELKRRRKDGLPAVVNVGSLVPVKDQLTLIAALAVARDRGQPFQLEIVGDGPLRPALLAEADRRRVGDLVRLPGAVSHERIASIYRRADLFTLSSRHEAQCLAAIEAAACGRVVIGTRVGVIPELAGPGGAVPPREPNKLADAIASALTGRSAPGRDPGVARAVVEARFALGVCTERFRALYQTLISRVGSGSK
jgi:glycosyltransferase involved in cell wall biosynthesis